MVSFRQRSKCAVQQGKCKARLVRAASMGEVLIEA